MSDRGPDLRCSFCSKSCKDVALIIAGPDGVSICEECVGLCFAIVVEQLQARYRELAALKATGAAAPDVTGEPV